VRLLLIALPALLTSVSVTGAAQRATAGNDSLLADEARGLVMARLTAFAGGDSAAFHRLIVPGFVHVYDGGWRETGDVLLRKMASDRVGAEYARTGRFTVTEVHARVEGSTMLIDDAVSLRFNPGAVPEFSSRWRETNVLVRVDGKWRFAQHSETPILSLGGHPVTAALPDSATLRDFVGDYAWPGGDLERITQRGARLYGQDAKDPKDPPHAWVAAGAEAFYPEGDASGLTVFARDATGRVTHLFARITGGPLMIARRVR
jgi:hypothetical protein